ncbi:MAG: hypothetical protein AAFU66_08630, partial [Pseudomonadota bacterium]
VTDERNLNRTTALGRITTAAVARHTIVRIGATRATPRRDAPESCRSVEVALVCNGSYTETSPGTQSSVVTCLE